MVRPERFELPTLWFEAKCSIQLSYGREDRLYKANGESLPRQLRRRNRFRRKRRNKHRHGFDNVETCAAQELMDHWLC